MAKKRAVIGLRGIALGKVKTDTISAYQSETAAPLPFAGAMNRTPKETTQDLFYDDELYAQVRDVQGEDVEIRLGEVDLAQVAELGFGVYDSEKGLFEGNFNIEPGSYSLRCITDTVDRAPYYWNWRLFELTGFRFDNFATKGSSITVCEVIINGVFKSPAMPTVKDYAIMQLLEDGSNQAACEAFLTGGETFPVVPNP